MVRQGGSYISAGHVYIISFHTRHNQSIHEVKKQSSDTDTTYLACSVNVLLMTSQPILQWIMRSNICDAGTWKVMADSLDINLFQNRIHNRSCQNIDRYHIYIIYIYIYIYIHDTDKLVLISNLQTNSCKSCLPKSRATYKGTLYEPKHSIYNHSHSLKHLQVISVRNESFMVISPIQFSQKRSKERNMSAICICNTLEMVQNKIRP